MQGVGRCVRRPYSTLEVRAVGIFSKRTLDKDFQITIFKCSSSLPGDYIAAFDANLILIVHRFAKLDQK